MQGFADELAVELEAVRSRLAEVAAGSEPELDRLKALAELRKDQLTLLRAHGYQTERIGNLSTKLRLTPSRARLPGEAISRPARSARARGHGRIGATPPEKKGPPASHSLPTAGMVTHHRKMKRRVYDRRAPCHQGGSPCQRYRRSR